MRIRKMSEQERLRLVGELTDLYGAGPGAVLLDCRTPGADAFTVFPEQEDRKPAGHSSARAHQNQDATPLDASRRSRECAEKRKRFVAPGWTASFMGPVLHPHPPMARKKSTGAWLACLRTNKLRESRHPRTLIARRFTIWYSWSLTYGILSC
ncbi:MAG: hypothetical protein H8F28_01675 [Fibrella sp.]|nr:hypothetical protein [Armatimonadota bacterium]